MLFIIFGFEIEFEIEASGLEVIDAVIAPAEDEDARILDPDVICDGVDEELAAENEAAFAITACDWTGKTDIDAVDVDHLKKNNKI